MNGDPKYCNELEDLLSSALLEAGQRTKRNRTAAGKMYVPVHQRSKFTDPENWSLAESQVQLVHRENNLDTLVGLFDEYRHRDRADARKLVASQRIEGSMAIRIEYVTGDSWLGKALEIKRKTPDRVVQLCEDVILDMGVSAPAVLVDAVLVGGGVARVLLQSPTRFEGFTPRTVVILPGGMDILEGLTQGTKERIWAEVQKVLGLPGESLMPPEEE